MNSLLKFIIKHSFTLAFIFFEIICFILIFRGNDYQRAKYFYSSNSISASISEKWTNVVGYTKLRAINDSLAVENEHLRNILEIYRWENIPPIERSGFEYISAKVVYATTNRIKNFITINKGLNHSVTQDMGVIGPSGVVGIVYVSSDKYSSILPIINPETKISVKIQKNDFFGPLSWEGPDTRVAILTEIPGYVDVQEGDLIVTSGFSAMFPENIPVGTVKSFTKDKSTDFYTIEVELITDFNNISYVYVVKNINYQDQIQFEDNEE